MTESYIRARITMPPPVVARIVHPSIWWPGGGVGAGSGWSPVIAVEADGERRVQRITEWIGGTGTPPVPGYIGPAGLVATAAEATDIRGAAGAKGDEGDVGPAGGADWSQAVLASDFSVTGTTTTLVPGMAFTLEADAIYEVYARLLLRTNDTNSGAQFGWSVPDGMNDGSVRATNPNTGTSQRFDVSPATVSARSYGGSLSGSTASYLGTLDGLLVADASISGDFVLTLQSEIDGKTATIKAGSFMRWRRVK